MMPSANPLKKGQMHGDGICSPKGELAFKQHESCFDADALQLLARLYNDRHPQTPIGVQDQESPAKLAKALRKKLSHVCRGKGANTEACWVDKLDATRAPAVVSSLRPKKPRTWSARPREWLNNYDIDAVMNQYSSSIAFKFAFLGVHPVDFAEPDASSGQCYAPYMCSVQLVKDLISNGKVYAGFITNMDRHDQPGSHWTSTFAVLDPSLPSYGVYYYDSVGKAPPPPIARYLESWRQQMEKAHPNVPFRVDWSRSQHQFANTECGMFSMLFVILWLERLKYDSDRKAKKAMQEERAARKLAKGKLPIEAKRLLTDSAPVTFEMITSLPLRDVNAFKLRELLFRAAGGKAKRDSARLKKT